MSIESRITCGPAMKLLPDGMLFTNEIEGVVGSQAQLILCNTEANGSHLYYLEGLVTQEGFKKKGLATDLLQKINGFLEEKKTIGLLVNVANGDSGESKIYSKKRMEKSQ